jgi:hypothetical protein
LCVVCQFRYDYVHFLWVFSLQLNILFGLPPLFVLLGEIFFQASEVYTDTMERRRKELFSGDHTKKFFLIFDHFFFFCFCDGKAMEFVFSQAEFSHLLITNKFFPQKFENKKWGEGNTFFEKRSLRNPNIFKTPYSDKEKQNNLIPVRSCCLIGVFVSN